MRLLGLLHQDFLDVSVAIYDHFLGQQYLLVYPTSLVCFGQLEAELILLDLANQKLRGLGTTGAPAGRAKIQSLLIYCEQLFRELFLDISFLLAIFEDISILPKPTPSTYDLILGTRCFGRWLLGCRNSPRFGPDPVC